MKAMNMDLVLHQDTIQYIIQNRKSQFGAGFLFGAVAGGLFMNAMFRGNENSWIKTDPYAATVLGGMGGGLIGGLMGAAATKRTIEIGKLKPDEKRKVLKNLFN
jgi:outer membrane lipoprotein SlyB